MPDEGENSFKMPRASVVHMTSTATRPQHMSQVSITVPLTVIRAYHYRYYSNRIFLVSRIFLFLLFLLGSKKRRRDSKERGRGGN